MVTNLNCVVNEVLCMMCGVLCAKSNCRHWLDSSFGIIKDKDLVPVLHVQCSWGCLKMVCCMRKN